MILVYILFITFIVVNCQKVSPRYKLQEYLKKNNCKSRLLNTLIANSANRFNNYITVGEITRNHLTQFKQEQVYLCYEAFTKLKLNLF